MANVTYTDRFGYTWQVRSGRSEQGETVLVFTHRSIRLVGEEAVDDAPGDLGTDRLKDLYCDAEREIEVDGEMWFVGYRSRWNGSRGGNNAQLCTRFRSASGEVRYSTAMLPFRHMSAAGLRDQLGSARAGTARKR